MGILPDWAIRRDIKITPFAEGIKRENTISYGLTSYGYDARLGRNFKVFDPANIQTRLDTTILETLGEHKLDTWRGLPVIDPKRTYWQQFLTEYKDVDSVIIPPNSFALAETLEHFVIPRDVLCIVMGKSTYARCATFVNVTPGEPEWSGKWTVELSNNSPLPLRIYAEEGIMQTMFLRSDGIHEATGNAVRKFLDRVSREGKVSLGINAAMAYDIFNIGMKQSTCEKSYADKKGKYNNQTGLTVPTVDQHNEEPRHSE